MDSRRPRALLALLCVVALLYGAVLFQPAFRADLTGSADDVGTTTPADVRTATTTTPTPTSTSETATATPTATKTPTATETTPTPTATETDAAVDSGETDGGGGFARFVVVAVVALGASAAVAVIGYAVAGSESSQQNDGGPSVASFDSLPDLPVIDALPRVSQVTTAMVLTSAGGLARVAAGLTAVGGGLARALRSAGPLLGMVGRGLAAIPVALTQALVAPFAALGSIGTGSVSFVGDGISKAIGSETPTDDARETASVEPESEDGPDPVESVSEAWARMTDLVRVRNPESTTPVEYARAAIEAGLPASPVRQLTDCFRRIRYGPETEAERHVSTARDALDALREADD